MKDIQDHFRCTEPYCKEIQRMNVMIIFPDGVGLPPSMHTRGKQLEVQLKWWLFNFNQNLCHIFTFNDTAVLITYNHADTHTLDHRQKHGLWRHAFSLPVPRSQGTWGTHDSECLNFRCLNHSGAKIMAFQGEGQMWEVLFKAPEFRRSAWSCVDGGQPLPIYLQGLCSVSIFNLMRCRTSYFQALDLPVEA